MFRDETAKVLDKAAQPGSTSWGSGSAQTYPYPNFRERVSRPTGNLRNAVAPLPPGDFSAIKQEILLPATVYGDPRCPTVPAVEAGSPSLLDRVALPNVEILTQYLFDQIVLSDTWLSLLPSLYSRTDGKSALRWSIHAASLFLMANQTGDHTAMARARTSYGRSLHLLNTRLGDLAEKLEDETFCTILVLHLINDIAGERSLSSGLHLKACSALFLQRHRQKHLAASNCKIANSLVIQSQAYVLKYYEHCSELYAEQICRCASAQPAADILRQCLEVGKLRSTIDGVHASSSDVEPAAELHLLNVMRTAQKIDLALEEWEKSLTGRWLRKTVTHKLSSMLEVNIDFYSDIQVGKVWNQYRCARIFLHEAMIETLELLGSINARLGHEMVSAIKRSAQVITTMLSAICDSIPFHLQQVDCKGELVTRTSQRVLGAEHLLWPLDVIFHSQWSSESQRNQAYKALAEIDTCLGLKQASRSIQLGNSSPTHPSSLIWSDPPPNLMRSQIQDVTA